MGASKHSSIGNILEAQKQLLDYEKDEIVTTYIKDGLKLQKVVIGFWGWEMVYCKIMDKS